MFAIKKSTADKSPFQTKEVVTIGLYCPEANAQVFDMVSQIKQIEHIRRKITEVAIKAGKKSPDFVLSVLLVPDWERKSNSYDDETYQRAHKDFFKKLNEKTTQFHCGYEIQDAYKIASVDERKYLNQLRNFGANADWIKTHALIANQGVKHLQLDSNTQISDYNSFYEHTFGQDKHDALHANEHDGLNASAYDANTTYVSAHNKVVYTVPGGKIVPAITKPFLEYCVAHQDPSDPDKDKNAIYSKVFCPSLAKVELTIHKTVHVPNEGLKDRYLVDFNKPEYGLTKDVITAVNMSWAANSIPDPHADLKKIPALKYKDAEITFPCFINLVNVHTAPFVLHDDRDSLNRFRNKLHDREKDIKIIREYYNYIAENRADLLLRLVKTIPQDKDGNQLCLEAFGCDSKALRQQAIKNEIQKVKGELDNLQTRPQKVTIKEKSALLVKLNKVTQQLEVPAHLPSKSNALITPLANIQPTRLNSSFDSNYMLPTREQIVLMDKKELERHKEIIQSKIDPIGKSGPKGIERNKYKASLYNITEQLSVLGQEHAGPSSSNKKK